MSPQAFEHRLVEPLGRFLDAAHQIEPHRLPALIAETASELGANRCRVWLADHQMRDLVELGVEGGSERIPIEGTMAGRAFVTSETVEAGRDDDGVELWLPLLDGVDRIGVL
jgi:hypothetical protein